MIFDDFSIISSAPVQFALDWHPNLAEGIFSDILADRTEKVTERAGSAHSCYSSTQVRKTT